MTVKINFQIGKRWIVLPLFSGLLLTLSFYPFDLWYFSFIALVPIFLLLSVGGKVAGKKIFWGGFIVGAIFSLFLSFFTLFQFHWLQEAHLFVWLIKLMPIPIAIISGTIVGLIFLLYKKISFNKPVDIFILTAISVLIEIIQSNLFAGFNSGLLAYASHSLTPLLRLSSVIGVFGVSFIITLINSFIAFFIIRPDYRKKIIIFALISFAIIFLINFINNNYLGSDGDYQTAKFAIIQNADRGNVLGSVKNGELYLTYQGLIAEARYYKPDFIIYPFSLFNGYLADNIKNVANEGLKKAVLMDSTGLGKWIDKNAGFQSIFVNWINVVRNDNVYPEMLFWQGKNQLANYQKRDLFPFMDYTPELFKNIGLFTTSVDAQKAESNNLPVQINNIKFAPLICSELFHPELSREDSLKGANVLISIGSEAMFSDEIPGKWNLIVSQFRAAENNRPLVRANILGGSALIDENGKIIKESGFGKTGVLVGELNYKKSPKNTFYSYFGDTPFIIAIIIFLALCVFVKFRNKRVGVV